MSRDVRDIIIIIIDVPQVGDSVVVVDSIIGGGRSAVRTKTWFSR
jgi:hypothetical protein